MNSDLKMAEPCCKDKKVVLTDKVKEEVLPETLVKKVMDIIELSKVVRKMGFFDNVMSSDCYGYSDSSLTDRMFEERQREERERQERERQAEERRYYERMRAERGSY